MALSLVSSVTKTLVCLNDEFIGSFAVLYGSGSHNVVRCGSYSHFYNFVAQTTVCCCNAVVITCLYCFQNARAGISGIFVESRVTVQMVPRVTILLVNVIAEQDGKAAFAMSVSDDIVVVVVVLVFVVNHIII